VCLDAPVSEGVELPLADLAAGLLRQWALGTTRREWAAVVLMLSDVQFQEGESLDRNDCWTPCGPRLLASPFLTMPSGWRVSLLWAYNCRSRAASFCVLERPAAGARLGQSAH
jgi:hypothetical protein